MCIIVLMDVHNCAQDGGICVHGCVYVLNNVHMCSRSGMCWEKDVIWALRVRYNLW
jgi:hypothetical protein